MAYDFEWDAQKARINRAKHGVTFEAVRPCFSDPFALEWEDSGHAAKEARFILLGQADDRLYVVVYTWRDDVIRLISARRAEPFERRLYHENQKA